jgi:hypothetical protein
MFGDGSCFKNPRRAFKYDELVIISPFRKSLFIRVSTMLRISGVENKSCHSQPILDKLKIAKERKIVSESSFEKLYLQLTLTKPSNAD